MDETVRMAGGRLFHASDVATGKARSPRVDRCTEGTTSVMVVLGGSGDDLPHRLSDERSQRDMAALIRLEIGMPQRRDGIESVRGPATNIRRRSRRSGVMRSELLAENTSRAGSVEHGLQPVTERTIVRILPIFRSVKYSRISTSIKTAYGYRILHFTSVYTFSILMKNRSSK